MTVIAWDGKTLAADKEASDAWVKASRTTKIHRRDNGLLAFAGNASMGRELLAWFDAGANPADFPSGNRDASNPTRLMHITLAGEILVYECGPYPLRFENEIYALGSGREAALAVMMLGHDATKAVEIASRLCTGCGNGIDTLELHP
jgi:ATP-dependent protease HslVU (ClpYQ) peptidase subunit